MNKLFSALKQWRSHQVLAILLAGLLSLTSNYSRYLPSPNQLIATRSNAELRDRDIQTPAQMREDAELLYPDVQTPSQMRQKEKELPKITEETNPPQIPAQPQLVIDRSDPNAKIVERAGQAFQKASEFITDNVAPDFTD